MLKRLKYKLYFFVAGYFRFFAKIQLALWKPRIIVVTGSNGKTTLLHLIESQLKNRARYSHHANSSFGIPFDILNLHRQTFKAGEWLYLFLLAPLKALKKPYTQKIYVVEADCDRPGEGKFLADLLNPEVTIWASVGRTHSMNFDFLVKQGKFRNVDDAIAHEFGYFLENTKALVVINGDEALMRFEAARSKAPVKNINSNQLNSYEVLENSTEFVIGGVAYHFNCLLPKQAFVSVAQTVELLKFMGLNLYLSFQNFVLPPGRSSFFLGIKNIKIIDSSYNANLQSMAAVLEMFGVYKGKIKWAVLGDMLEQGNEEKEEHENLAELITALKLDKVILMGPRVCKYTYPKLMTQMADEKIAFFEKPKEALDFLQENLRGNETVLFKGARFMEGIVEHLLLNKADANKLCRREKVWENRRKEWGL
ncbi:MAG TPA: cyanophycin synthetase [Candidatus Limnocylindria bacterium]|nr:cyanophycin synthetase [Candidatus Limnocylindria bacterium]